jgi:hypothetical protein
MTTQAGLPQQPIGAVEIYAKVIRGQACQIDLICAPQLISAGSAPTAPNGGYFVSCDSGFSYRP